MKHALVLGGTRGIGLAMAERCLERGMAVTVCGRHPDALRASPLGHHAALRIVALDIADPQAVRTVVSEAGAPQGALDLMVVTAGTYFNTRTHRLDQAATLQLLRTNVSGLSLAFEAGAERMLAQGHGRMAAVSSMAIDAGEPVCAFPWQMRTLVGLLNWVSKLKRLPDFPPTIHHPEES